MRNREETKSEERCIIVSEQEKSFTISKNPTFILQIKSGFFFVTAEIDYCNAQDGYVDRRVKEVLSFFV